MVYARSENTHFRICWGSSVPMSFQMLFVSFKMAKKYIFEPVYEIMAFIT